MLWDELRELSSLYGLKDDIENVAKGIKKAAVVLLLRYRAGYELLFIKRSSALSYHSGQVSFPGGAFEDGDKGLKDTALRELKEEVGVERDRVELFFSLDSVSPVTSPFYVLPFVGGLVYNTSVVPNQEEVDAYFWVPIRFFINTPYTEECIFREGKRLCFPVYHFEDYKIWGMTARIIVDSALPIFRRLGRCSKYDR